MTPFSAASLFRLLVLPPAGFFLMLAICWLCRRRFPRFSKVLTVGTLVVAYVLCAPAGANLFVTPLENLAVPLATGSNTGAQAIVVLAAGRLSDAPEYAGSHIPDYIALARLRYAARLQHETGLPVLVTGGNRSDDARQDSKGASMARALREDFRTPVTWIEDNSETTAENASRSRVILQANGIRRILLVTDAMHMARSEAVFRAVGLQVIAAPTMFFRLDKLDPVTFFPSAEGLRRSWYALYELIGLYWYRLQAR